MVNRYIFHLFHLIICYSYFLTMYFSIAFLCRLTWRRTPCCDRTSTSTSTRTGSLSLGTRRMVSRLHIVNLKMRSISKSHSTPNQSTNSEIFFSVLYASGFLSLLAILPRLLSPMITPNLWIDPSKAHLLTFIILSIFIAPLHACFLMKALRSA